MFIRIVKMGFHPDKTEAFLQNFELNKHSIRGFEGCMFLELYRDKDNTNQFFTYSYWKDENSLENYRNSELFKKYGQKPRCFSTKNPKPGVWIN